MKYAFTRHRAECMSLDLKRCVSIASTAVQDKEMESLRRTFETDEQDTRAAAADRKNKHKLQVMGGRDKDKGSQTREAPIRFERRHPRRYS